MEMAKRLEDKRAMRKDTSVNTFLLTPGSRHTETSEPARGSDVAGVDEGLGYTLPQGTSPAGLSEGPSASLEGDVGHGTFPRNPEQVHMPRGDLDDWRFEGGSRSRNVFGGNHPTGKGSNGHKATLYEALDLKHVEIDPDEYMAHRLTDVERAQFEANG